MKFWCLPLLLALVIPSLTHSIALVKLDGYCDDTADCAAIDNSDCRLNKCICKPGYFGVNGTTECHLVTIGFDCSFFNVYTCMSLKHGVCDITTWTCRCRRGYTGVDGGHTCAATLAGYCSETDDCVAIDNSECRLNKCKCRPGYYGVRGTAECFPVSIGCDCSVLNRSCSGIIGKGVCNPNTLKCMCRRGYYGIVGGDTCTRTQTGTY